MNRHSLFIEYINSILSSVFRELEEYIYYCLRCLSRMGVKYNLNDFVSFTNMGGSRFWYVGVGYPHQDFSNLKDWNPLFFKAIIFRVDDKLDSVVPSVFVCENVFDLLRVLRW